MATSKPRHEKAEPAGRVHRREFRLPAGREHNDATQVLIAESLARGWRPVDAPYIESDETEGDERVVTWAVRVEENVA